MALLDYIRDGVSAIEETGTAFSDQLLESYRSLASAQGLTRGVTHPQKQGRRIAAKILSSVGQERPLLVVIEADWAVLQEEVLQSPRAAALPQLLVRRSRFPR